MKIKIIYKYLEIQVVVSDEIQSIYLKNQSVRFDEICYKYSEIQAAKSDENEIYDLKIQTG